MIFAVNPTNYAHGSWIVAFCCGMVQVGILVQFLEISFKWQLFCNLDIINVSDTNDLKSLNNHEKLNEIHQCLKFSRLRSAQEESYFIDHVLPGSAPETKSIFTRRQMQHARHYRQCYLQYIPQIMHILHVLLWDGTNWFYPYLSEWLC